MLLLGNFDTLRKAKAEVDEPEGFQAAYEIWWEQRRKFQDHMLRL